MPSVSAICILSLVYRCYLPPISYHDRICAHVASPRCIPPVIHSTLQLSRTLYKLPKGPDIRVQVRPEGQVYPHLQ